MYRQVVCHLAVLLVGDPDANHCPLELGPPLSQELEELGKQGDVPEAVGSASAPKLITLTGQ